MNNNYSLALDSGSKISKDYFIVFKINDIKYAINICNVAEIINIPKIEIPEHTPVGIIGMFNYNGTMIKAIDLCPFLGFKTSNFSVNNSMIIVCFNGEYLAVRTENIDTILKFDEENIQNIPYNAQESFLKQVYKTECDNINIIDGNILFEIISRKDNPKSEINYADYFPSDEKSKELLSIRAKNQIISQDIFSFPSDILTAKQYILFNMDNQNYYLDIKYIKEFVSLRRLNITKLPYTPDYIAGIVSIKGEFVLVVNLKRFLSGESAEDCSGRKLIVVESENFNIAFLVDDIKYIRNLKNIKRSNMYSSSSEYIYAEFMEEEKLYNILNIEKLLNDERLYINIG